MTREERLDWLCRLRSEIYVHMPYEWIKPMDEALTESIKALEQEPCEDISPTAIPLTIEEAKKLLYAEWKKEVQKDTANNRLLVAYNMAIKALEREPKTDVLNKIRTEIELHRRKTETIDTYDLVGDCLDIIDKYKAESEAKE